MHQNNDMGLNFLFMDEFEGIKNGRKQQVLSFQGELYKKFHEKS